jgi:transcriptional regulator with XRE-family HTH domain
MKEQDKRPNEKLKRERELRGWSQRTIAARVGTAEQVVARWEGGRHKPNRYFQTQLCELFGKNAEELGFLIPAVAIPSHEYSVQKIQNTINPPILNNGETVQNFEASFVPSSHQQEEILTQLSRGEIRQQELFNSIMIEMSYPRWVAAMEAFWQLYFTGGIPVIEACLPRLLGELLIAVSEPSKMQKQIMTLASQAYQMHWLLSLQRQDFGQALLAIDQAYIYSKGAQDANLELASLVRKAHVYFHLKNPVKQLVIHEQAMQSVTGVSPLMRSWFYLLLSENHASLRHQKEATTFLERAHKALPDHPAQDEAFSYVRMNTYLISNFEIICHLHLHQPQQALDTLEHLGLSENDPRCSELSNHRLTALYLLHEREELYRQFPGAVQMAQKTKSLLRYHELCGIYCKIVDRWPEERNVRELEGLLRI